MYIVRKRIILPPTAAILLLAENIAGVYKKLKLLVQNIMDFGTSPLPTASSMAEAWLIFVRYQMELRKPIS